jgi:catechol 2,3-dioxygenase-like lactoylglutathione lyase family enzyme
MPLGGLQHYTIEPSDLERTKNFYCDVLGLENGERPPLDFPGYWLYSGGAATVHLMGTRKPREGIVVRGTEKKFEDRPSRPYRLCGHRCRSCAQAAAVEEREIPREHRSAHGDTQIFLYDPDGVGVELNFPKS